jgi:hypothetical protein
MPLTAKKVSGINQVVAVNKPALQETRAAAENKSN